MTTENRSERDTTPDSFGSADTYRVLGHTSELQTRTEHSRSLEDAERYRALETLKELGALIPLSEVEVFHGRVNMSDKFPPWEVEPDFANGGNDSGNANVNKRATLYTGERQIAEDFSLARLEHLRARTVPTDSQEFRAEVHKIVAHDMDACIFDYNFYPGDLEPEQQAQYRAALQHLAIMSMTEASPVRFEDREAIQVFHRAFAQKEEPKIFQDTDLEKLITEAGLDRQTATHLAGAANARTIALSNPGFLINELVGSASDLVSTYITVNGERMDVPLNLEYAQEYLQAAHIVGIRQPVFSATLERRMDVVSFFDLDKVNTPRAINAERERTWRQFGGLAESFKDLLTHENQQRQPLMRLLEDAHAKPPALVGAARRVDSYDAVYAADAGNWEGYTLGEHTETLLRIFEETYADKLPVGLLAPVRLLILAHDLGKPEAVARGEKRHESQYNVARARHFFNELGVDEATQGFLIAILGAGSDIAYLMDIRQVGDVAERGMRQLATASVQELTGRSDVRGDEITAFTELCRMLQRCDGAAYTSIGITRDQERGGYYRNAPSFNASFAAPVDMGRRSARLRQFNEPAAPAYLTPQLPDR